MNRSLRTTLITSGSLLALALPALVFADDSFVPLTQLPGIANLTSSPSLPSFINNLYRICIGLAGFLAVTRFAYAGYKIMSNTGSVMQNKQAREIITNTVFGLILVLSPAVVFGVINPKILDVSLDFKGLQSKKETGPDVNNTDLYLNSADPKAQKATCDAYLKPGRKIKDIAVSSTQTCLTQGTGWTEVVGCCANLADGHACCGYDPEINKYVPPTDNTGGVASFAIVFQSRDDLTGKACVDRAEQSYPDKQSCYTGFNNAISKGLFAVEKTCDETGLHGPTPSGPAAKLKAFPVCPK
jgi:hypothetical protein